MKTTVTQSKQRAAQQLLASLVPAHLAPEKPFAYVVNRTNDDNPMKGAPPRISFVAESVESRSCRPRGHGYPWLRNRFRGARQ